MEQLFCANMEKTMDWMTAAGTLAVAAITALLRSQGRDVTAAELGRNADKYVDLNVKNLTEDEAEETERYKNGQ